MPTKYIISKHTKKIEKELIRTEMAENPLPLT